MPRRAARTAAIRILLAALVISAAAIAGCQPLGGPTIAPTAPPRPRPSAPASAAATPAAETPAPAATKPTAPAPSASSPAGGATGKASNRLLAWNFQRNKKHKVPEIPTEAKKLVKQYGAMHVGPDPGLAYLTFDEGYENGNTPKILDTLKRNGVHATFFVTGDFCREAPKLCRRMLAEGHVVASHSDKHPSMPSVTPDPARFEKQFSRADSAYKKATGKHLTRLFRPPMGEYSAKSLAMTNDLGYTTVFWSFAHVDYDEKNQPPVATTVDRVLTGSHPGAIFLLHGISTSDTAALDAIIAGLRTQGYGFGTLDAPAGR